MKCQENEQIHTYIHTYKIFFQATNTQVWQYLSQRNQKLPTK